MVGAGLALILYLLRTMKPRVATLGRYPDGTLRDIQVNPGLPTSDHVVAMCFDGQLYFANVAFFEDRVLEAVADHPKAKYLLIVGNGAELVFSGLKKQVLDVMRTTNLFESSVSGTSSQPRIRRSWTSMSDWATGPPRISFVRCVRTRHNTGAEPESF